MTKAEQDLIDLVKDGQSGKYNSFVRHFAGDVRKLVEMKNPLIGAMMVDEIDRIFEIINPELKGENEWFKQVKKLVKLWTNEKIITNRLLGIKNDNEYDMRVFEKVVLDKFFMQLKGKKPNQNTIIQTDFNTMAELVEMGARRF